jgi:hypothetical protein
MLKKTSQACFEGMINLCRFATAAHLEADRIKNQSAKSTYFEDGLLREFRLALGNRRCETFLKFQE